MKKKKTPQKDKKVIELLKKGRPEGEKDFYDFLRKMKPSDTNNPSKK